MQLLGPLAQRGLRNCSAGDERSCALVFVRDVQPEATVAHRRAQLPARHEAEVGVLHARDAVRREMDCGAVRRHGVLEQVPLDDAREVRELARKRHA